MDKALLKGLGRELAIAVAIVFFSVISKSENFAVVSLLLYLIYGLIESLYSTTQIETKKIIYRLLGCGLLLACGLICFFFSVMLILESNVIRISHG